MGYHGTRTAEGWLYKDGETSASVLFDYDAKRAQVTIGERRVTLPCETIEDFAALLLNARKSAREIAPNDNQTNDI